MGSRGIAAYACASLFLGLLFVGLTIGAQTLGAALTAGLVAVFSALGLWCVARLAGRRLAWRLDWTRVFLCALVAVAVLGGAAFAMLRIGAALSAFVISAIPLVATVGAQLTGRARLTGPTALGLGLGLLGLYLVASTPVGDPSWRFIVGILNALVVTVIAGASGRWLARVADRADAAETAIAALLVAALPLFGVTLFSPTPIPPGGAQLWVVPLLIVLALGCGVLLLVSMSAVVADIPVRAATTLPGVGTVLAALGGVLLLGEQVSALEWVGAALILAGTALLRGLLEAFFGSTSRH